MQGHQQLFLPHPQSVTATDCLYDMTEDSILAAAEGNVYLASRNRLNQTNRRLHQLVPAEPQNYMILKRREFIFQDIVYQWVLPDLLWTMRRGLDLDYPFCYASSPPMIAMIVGRAPCLDAHLRGGTPGESHAKRLVSAGTHLRHCG